VTPSGKGGHPGGWWNVPPSNSLFTGRTEVLKQLRAALEKRRRAALVGMPGVGKTQTAIEYAHRHRTDYAAVLWAGADSPETLTSGYVALARLLGLPQRNEPDQTVIVAAVRRWLGETPDWLLVLDNADDLGAVRACSPPTARVICC
jgi:MoxR-like ATPase